MSAPLHFKGSSRKSQMHPMAQSASLVILNQELTTFPATITQPPVHTIHWHRVNAVYTPTQRTHTHTPAWCTADGGAWFGHICRDMASALGQHVVDGGDAVCRRLDLHVIHCMYHTCKDKGMGKIGEEDV
eukprot:1160744-Pelagomonas_calceolata.AAC.18